MNYGTPFKLFFRLGDMRLSLLLPALLVFTALPAFAEGFVDMQPLHQNAKAIDYLQSNKVMVGYSDNTFGPDRTLNRAELLKILVESKIGRPHTSDTDCFLDTPPHAWYTPYVCYAYDSHWIDGYEDGTFHPNDPVTMAQALKMLVNVRGYHLVHQSSLMPDASDPSAWYAPYLETALAKNIVSSQAIWGSEDVRLDEPLPRAKMAEFLYRALLTDQEIGFQLPTSTCDPKLMQWVDLKNLQLKNTVDVFAGMGQGLVAVDGKGHSCGIVQDLDPYSFVGPNFGVELMGTYPGGDGTRSKLAEGKAVFSTTCECDGGGFSGLWELDLNAGTFKQIGNTEPAVWSEDARFFVYFLGRKQLWAYDVLSDQTKQINSVTDPLALVTNDSTVPSFSGSTLHYNVYDHDTGRITNRLQVNLRAFFSE